MGALEILFIITIIIIIIIIIIKGNQECKVLWASGDAIEMSTHILLSLL